MEDDRLLSFINENGETEEYYMIEETKINNINYILVADSKEDDATAYIFKEISDEDSEEAMYVAVDDDNEIEYIGKIFSELLDDEDIGLE